MREAEQVLKTMLESGYMPESLQGAALNALRKHNPNLVEQKRLIAERWNAINSVPATTMLCIPAGVVRHALRAISTAFFLHDDLSPAEQTARDALETVLLEAAQSKSVQRPA